MAFKTTSYLGIFGWVNLVRKGWVSLERKPWVNLKRKEWVSLSEFSTQTKISTDHHETSVSSLRELSNLVAEASTSKFKILEIAHSHPIAEANFPSGFYPSGQIDPAVPRGGDRGVAEMVEQGYRKNMVAFKLYVGPTDERIYYNSNKIYKE